MSESYVTTETIASMLTDAVETVPHASARFTPLRSEIVVRDHKPHSDRGDCLSPIVPVKRPHK